MKKWVPSAWGLFDLLIFLTIPYGNDDTVLDDYALTKTTNVFLIRFLSRSLCRRHITLHLQHQKTNLQHHLTYNENNSGPKTPAS